MYADTGIFTVLCLWVCVQFEKVGPMWNFKKGAYSARKCSKNIPKYLAQKSSYQVDQLIEQLALSQKVLGLIPS